VSVTAAEVKAALKARHANAGAGAWVCIEEALSGFATYSTGGIDLLALGCWQSAKVPGLRGSGKRRSSTLRTVGGTPMAPDTSYPIVAYEVKVSRSDFRRELYGYTPGPGTAAARRGGVPAWPVKAQAALDRSHYFVFAVPKGLLRPDELAQRGPWATAERVEEPGSLFTPPAPAAAPRGSLWVPEGCGLVEVGPRGVSVAVQADPRHLERELTRAEVHELMRRADYCARREATAAARVATP
jgi:hypothetical protein